MKRPWPSPSLAFITTSKACASSICWSETVAVSISPNPVRDGILRHSKSRSGITHAAAGQADTLEGEVVRIADGIAYINHDLDDATRAGLIALEDVPPEVFTVLGSSHGERINTLVSDVITSSDIDHGGPILLSPDNPAIS